MPVSAPSSRGRIESIDVLRGVVMIFMALDHVREFFGTAINPTNLAQTTVPLFFTRWITHFCAPVFFLLMGTGAFLLRQKMSARELSKFLVFRGIWLIFLELVVLRCLGWQFNFDYRFTMIFILWALGWAMIVLAALIHLPVGGIAAFGIVLVSIHNLFDSLPCQGALCSILHAPNFLLQTPRYVVFEAYPLIPWVGVTAAGYSLGTIYLWPAERRQKFLLRLGTALTVGFFVLRTINRYGDPSRWSTQPSHVFTALSFLNTTKYPPSLLFLLMTLGPALLVLRALDGRMTPEFLRPVLTIGRVPLFYYVLHIPLMHLLALALCYLRYGAVHWMFESPSIDAYPFTRPPGWGFSLPTVYLVWALVVGILYPACRWFSGLKQQHRNHWLSYF